MRSGELSKGSPKPPPSDESPDTEALIWIASQRPGIYWSLVVGYVLLALFILVIAAAVIAAIVIR